VHDVALQNLKVVLCLDRGGIAGADGPTHHGAFDIAYFRCIPNMIVSAPMNEEELRNLMYTAQLDEVKGVFSIRYPRGNGVMVNWKTPFKKLEIGKGRKLKDGKDVAILSLGHPGNFAVKAIEKLETDASTGSATSISVAHYDLRFAKPLDEAMLHEVFAKYKKIITIEDGTIMGGVGSAILEFMSENGYSAQLKRLGIPDRFIEHGEPNELYTECGFSAEQIYDEVIEILKEKKAAKVAG
jgi:1-deoxy-D-xylulose-5-phosphate synthase